MAVHETEGELGVVYLDLYRRPHKFPGSAHFTLRCGRRASDGSYQVNRAHGWWQWVVPEQEQLDADAAQ